MIITDADYVSGSHGKHCEYTKSPDTTCNATIKEWYKEAYHSTRNVFLAQVDQLANDVEKKTIAKRHIEFQLMENGYKPRSLEDAILNVNKNLFGLSADDSPVYCESKYGKKTEFALKLLVEEEFKDYAVPSYIEKGLIWLNSQSVSE